MIRSVATCVFTFGLALAPGLIGSAYAQMPESLPAGAPLRLSAVTQPLPTQPQFTRVDIPYLREAIPKRSNGRISVQLSTHAERNLAGNEIVRLVRSGQVDIGAGTLSTLSGDVPLLDGIDLAGLSPEIGQAKKIAEAILPAANKELERFGVRLLAIYPFPAQVVFCRQPFTSLTDLKGKKVRTFGNSLNDFITTIGAQPVSIGFPEVYSALERGVTDCGITGTGSGASARWPEVTTHVSSLALSWALAGYMVNVAWWNRLDPEVRNFIEATFKEINDKQWELGHTATRDGITCSIGLADECKLHPLAARPMTEVKPVEADQALVTKTFRDVVLPNWVKRCGARCGEIYNQVIAPISGVEYRP
jgi:TRAP-type C4-dicarboxylate transport system substrate-binding protein